MSDELIKREDVLNVLKLFGYLPLDGLYYTIEHDLPSADRPKGEWIEDYNNTYSRRRMKCSVCGKFSGIGGIKSNQLKPYCPNCGARMKGADDE